jgi:hypothetical protein
VRARRRRFGGALRLKLRAPALTSRGLLGGDLGQVNANVRGERGARRVDVRLEAGVDGAGVEVPEVTSVDAQHHAIGHAELLLELYTHIHLRAVVLVGPPSHFTAQGVHALALVPYQPTRNL